MQARILWLLLAVVLLLCAIAGIRSCRYRGWYSLRRTGDGSWKITPASVDAGARAE